MAFEAYFSGNPCSKTRCRNRAEKESDFPAIDWTGGKERNFKTIEYMKRDSLFDKWFAFNYERLRAVFGRYLNEDAFHDAYLAMKKTCAFSDVAVERFEPYFSACTRNVNPCACAARAVTATPTRSISFAPAGRGNPSAEALAASDRLAYDILLFVRNKYPKRTTNFSG